MGPSLRSNPNAAPGPHCGSLRVRIEAGQEWWSKQAFEKTNHAGVDSHWRLISNERRCLSLASWDSLALPEVTGAFSLAGRTIVPSTRNKCGLPVIPDVF